MEMTYLQFVKDNDGRAYKLAVEISELRKQLENSKMAYYERIDSSFCFKTVSFFGEINQMEEIIHVLNGKIFTLKDQFNTCCGCDLDDLVLVDVLPVTDKTESQNS